MWYFYVLQSAKTPDYFYKGSTKKPYRPLRLVYYEAYLHEQSARHREMSVKKSGAAWGALMGRVTSRYSIVFTASVSRD